MKAFKFALLICVLLGSNQFVFSQEQKTPEELQQEAAELAKKLANPIASLISVPFQNNTHLGVGNLDGTKNILNFQPVIPIKLSENLTLINRVILPIVAQYNITDVGESEAGLGDTTLSNFFSPTNAKFTWGAGPAFLIPTGTNDYLSAKKFGIGPTAVALYQSNGNTFGALVNQIWSVAGDEDRSDVNALYFQPFFTHNWKSGAGVSANFEITQNWEASTTTVWFNPAVSALTSLGKQKTQFSIGPQFNLAAPDGALADFGVRAVVALIFPN